jgi:Flp pilus assembly protein TadD
VEEALVLARKAVELRPDFPPNQVALGEALQKNDAGPKAREALARALDLARNGSFAADPDAPSWIAEAEAMLRAIR